MADPLSVFASLLTVTTAGVQSTRSLKDLVNRYQFRDAILRRLLDKVADAETILAALEHLLEPAASEEYGVNSDTDADISMAKLLQGPVKRCSEICCEFECSMEQFRKKSKTSFIDWAKMEFRRGDINQFMDTLAEYKATIAVGVGVLTMRMAKMSREALDEYDTLVQNTICDLQIRLQRIDDKLQTLAPASDSNISSVDIDLNDERQVTEQCLRICQDAKLYLESLANKDPGLLQDKPLEDAAKGFQDKFEAQLLTSQALEDNQAYFVNIIAKLRKRLVSVVVDGDAGERKRLETDIETSRQCLEVCKLASDEVKTQKIHIVGDVTADSDSDHMVVTTLADMFKVGNSTARNGSALLVGSMSDETLQQISRDRYSSRFGALRTNDNVTRGREPAKNVEAAQGGYSSLHPKSKYPPSSNETRKRTEER